MERPILFSSPMIQAILAGRKTQTRRTVKIPGLIERPERFRYKGNSTQFDIPRLAVPYDDRLYHSWELVNSNMCSWITHSYKSGDILWVRETYAKLVPEHFITSNYVYKADMTPDSEEIRQQYIKQGYPYKWKPSIFMPKVACRIKLLIKNIQVERLQNITEQDAIAEGIGSGFQMNAGWPDYQHVKNGVCELTQDTAQMSYASLWESINGKDSWSKNPWVWKITFDKL